MAHLTAVRATQARYAATVAPFTDRELTDAEAGARTAVERATDPDAVNHLLGLAFALTTERHHRAVMLGATA